MARQSGGSRRRRLTVSVGRQADFYRTVVHRLGYGQFWGMRSGSGLVLGSGDGVAVAEADAANDLGETL
jgi:hypothetical protein